LESAVETEKAAKTEALTNVERLSDSIRWVYNDEIAVFNIYWLAYLVAVVCSILWCCKG